MAKHLDNRAFDRKTFMKSFDLITSQIVIGLKLTEHPDINIEILLKDVINEKIKKYSLLNPLELLKESFKILNELKQLNH